MAYKNERRRSENDVLDKQSEREMPFLRINFILMAIAGVMIVLGFLLMAGGANDWGGFKPDIFFTRRIVVGPPNAFPRFIFLGGGVMFSRNKK